MITNYPDENKAKWGAIEGTLSNQTDLSSELNNRVSKTLFNANTILKANTDDTPSALTIGTNQIVGRLSSSISSLTANEVRQLINTQTSSVYLNGGCELSSRTITIPHTYTATQIQAEIGAIGKYIPYGVTITIQFTNTSAKYLNNSAVVDLGGGLVKISCTGHGFVEGDVVSIDGTTNYNSDYTLPSQALGDADNFVISATYVAETPPTTAIARKPIDLSSTLTFKGFYGGGSMLIQGNNSENGAGGYHTTQQIYFRRTDGILMQFTSNQVSFHIYNIKGKVTMSSTTYILHSKISDIFVYYCYLLGTSTSYGNGIIIVTAGATGYITKTYFSNLLYGIQASQNTMIYSNDNDDYGTMPAYGLRSAASIIFKSGTQPTGSTANEGKTSGGQIF